MKTATSASTRKQFPVWILLPGLQVLLLCIFASNVSGKEWLVFGSFTIITGFASWQLFADEHPYSLNKIWWLFGIVFLGLAPSIQSALHHSPWREGDINPDTVLYANAIILASFVLYCLVRYFLAPRINFHDSTPAIIPSKFISRFRVAAPVIMVICGIAVVSVYGFKGLFLRGYAEAISQEQNPTFQLIFDKGIRGVMIYLSLATILLYREKKVNSLFCLFILTLSFLLNFPLAFSRNLAFTIYIAWLLAAGFSFIKTRYAFSTLILSLLLLAAPLADVTRYAGKDMTRRMVSPTALFRQAYLVSDFDAYSSLCRTIHFVDSVGSTHGRQGAGVLLFFVPRKIWPGKPIGSGSYLFTQLNFDFKNVSCTYLAEGYINFGPAGSLLFVALLCAIICIYDKWYWTYNRTFLYPTIFYPVLLGMMLFILRGDLLSSYAYTVGLFVSGWFVHRILMFRAK